MKGSNPIPGGADPSSASEAPASSPPLKVVVAYADAGTRERALRIHDHLVEELAEDFALQFTWWRFDFLRCPDMFEAAVNAAVEADLIVFAAHAGEELPARARAWVESWRGKRQQRKRALVALLGQRKTVSHASLPVHSLLEKVAQDTAMDFLPHSFPLWGENPCCLADPHSTPLHQIAPLLEDIMTRRPPTPDWGINE